MHHFDLPDAQVPRSLPDGDAAHLMNQFNFYCLSESPEFAEGHTTHDDCSDSVTIC
jgi:hypothetical protein